MKKQILTWFATVVMGIMLVSCGSSKYADIRAVMDKIGAATDTLVYSMDRANDAKAVANAVNMYTDAMKSEYASFINLMKKYPELKDAKDAPTELRESVEKINSMGEKLMTAMTKFQLYAEDPAVKEASKKMAELQLQ